MALRNKLETETGACLSAHWDAHYATLLDAGHLKPSDLPDIERKILLLKHRLPSSVNREDLIVELVTVTLRAGCNFINILSGVLLLTLGSIKPDQSIAEYLQAKWDDVRRDEKLNHFLHYGLEDFDLSRKWRDVQQIFAEFKLPVIRAILEKYSDETLLHAFRSHGGVSGELDPFLEYFDALLQPSSITGTKREPQSDVLKRGILCTKYNRREVLENPRELGAKVRNIPEEASNAEQDQILSKLGLGRNTHRYVYFDVDTLEWNLDVLEASRASWLGSDPTDTRPLAVVLVGAQDTNGYLSAVWTNIAPLLDAYRVITLETGDPEEASRLVQELAELRGRIQVLGIFAHGTAKRINLGEAPEQNIANSWLLSLEPHLNTAASLVIGSCDAREIIFRSINNKNRRMSSRIPKKRTGLEPLRARRPDLRIHTSGGVTNGVTWILDQQRRVQDVVFSLL
jgi:hypothetical protein